ncbi:MAG: 2-amino-4-hydroxy-6-hydroxymethyldihydropteridine diphosphokinase [Planctomycetes bacterium]|nr:2-amino-4-hydroxy-6-hydroxymethyldihydropteridine diphosphokinase [Planctomycetota bacterium]
MPATKAIIALGANLGEPAQAILEALQRLGREEGVRVLKVSRLMKTKPVDCPPNSPDFHNGVAMLDTTLDAQALLALLLATEAAMGRERGDQRNQPRKIDLDLIFFGDLVLSAESVEVPHPRMHERRFVLEPLNEIAPEWIHPTLQKTVQELFAAL